MITETGKKCADCLHWRTAVEADRIGECRRASPLPNGRERGIWPLVMIDDGCGYHRTIDAGPGRKPLLSDQEICAIVAEMGKEVPAAEGWAARSHVTKELVARGMGQSTAQIRVSSLIARGGLERRDGISSCPGWKIVVRSVPGWTGRPAKKAAPVAPPGRPVVHSWANYRDIILAVCATERRGVNLLHREVRKTTTIGNSAFQRVINEGVACGELSRAPDGFFASEPQPTPDGPDLT
jgi:hypothetical protein